ncbi:hypothetical protein [Pseudomonas saxonica]|uniref:Uncharacterized protein n=1 Tax=Pseudomonas saxonica TaxID=2600598 RepID=A0A5C5QA87_9PSED|nr:hypothetical protein [Pseudomonas saxonica]TWS00691.1 hypothetical protein FJD37_00230 [Pseudomonas saxonica]
MFGKESVAKDFNNAGELAKHWAEQDGLFPRIDAEGEQHYRIQQGLRAACKGREDVTSLIIVQNAVLRRLQELRVFAIIGLALLAYIAVRLT